MDAGVPKPTRDLAQAEQDLRDTGVCLLEGALPPETLARVREALYRAADDDRTRGCGSGSWGGQRPSLASYVAVTGPTGGATAPPEGGNVGYPLRRLPDAARCGSLALHRTSLSFATLAGLTRHPRRT